MRAAQIISNDFDDRMILKVTGFANEHLDHKKTVVGFSLELGKAAQKS